MRNRKPIVQSPYDIEDQTAPTSLSSRGIVTKRHDLILECEPIAAKANRVSQNRVSLEIWPWDSLDCSHRRSIFARFVFQPSTPSTFCVGYGSSTCHPTQSAILDSSPSLSQKT